MNEKFFKFLGIALLCLGFGFMYYGAEVPADEIAALSSKILGVISGIGGALIAFIGGKKNGK